MLTVCSGLTDGESAIWAWPSVMMSVSDRNSKTPALKPRQPVFGMIGREIVALGDVGSRHDAPPKNNLELEILNGKAFSLSKNGMIDATKDAPEAIATC